MQPGLLGVQLRGTRQLHLGTRFWGAGAYVEVQVNRCRCRGTSEEVQVKRCRLRGAGAHPQLLLEVGEHLEPPEGRREVDLLSLSLGALRVEDYLTCVII